jgi:hypothetical protein
MPYMITKIRQLAVLAALLGLVAGPIALQAQTAPAAEKPAPTTGKESEKKDAPAGDEVKKEEPKQDAKKEGDKKEETKPGGSAK